MSTKSSAVPIEAQSVDLSGMIEMGGKRRGADLVFAA
jgi:hypothetical protein